MFEDLIGLTDRLSNRLPLAQVLTELVAVSPPEKVMETRTLLAKTLDSLSEAEIDAERALMRLACVRLGSEFPRSLRRVLPLVTSELYWSVENYASDFAAVLPEVIARLAASTEPEVTSLRAMLTADMDRPQTFASSLRTLIEISALTIPGRLGRVADCDVRREGGSEGCEPRWIGSLSGKFRATCRPRGPRLMSFQGYLSFQQSNGVAGAIYRVLQYPSSVRSLLLRGLPMELKGIMSGGAAPGLVGSSSICRP